MFEQPYYLTPSVLEEPEVEFDDAAEAIDSLLEQRPVKFETFEQHRLVYEALKDASYFIDARVEPKAKVVLKSDG